LECSLKDKDTLRFNFKTLDAAKLEFNSLEFKFTNFHNPYSVRNIEEIIMFTYKDANCSDEDETDDV
jgi:hypothetical protein